jgi:protein-disulfide isomerase
MFDLIFENQNRLSRDMLLNLAKNLNLNINEFQKSLIDPVLAAKVESDFESGILSGVNGTPSFYINSQKYNGPYTFEDLGLALEMANRTALGNA